MQKEMDTKIASSAGELRLKVLQFVFTVATALATGFWGYFIHAAQQADSMIQAQMRYEQGKWQQAFQEKQNKMQQDQLLWQAEFQKTQLKSQEQIANNVAKLNTISAMNPFIDKITDADPAKARIAAYVLYLLNHDNPQMAVTLIAATRRKEMDDVLVDLSNMKPELVEYVGQFISVDKNDGIVKNNNQESLNRVISKMQKTSKGYCFFGRRIDNKWEKKGMVADFPIGLPQPGEEYIVSRSTYLRNAFPTIASSHDDLNLGKVVGVNGVNNKIRILDVKAYFDGAVWCALEIIEQAHNLQK